MAQGIGDLVFEGRIKGAHGKALTNKLLSAVKQISNGNLGSALDMLLALENQVEDLRTDGHLDPADADLILSWAFPIIEALGGSP